MRNRQAHAAWAILLLGAFTQGAAHGHAGHNEDRDFLILNAFPLEAEAYRPEVAQLVKDGIVEHWGHEEWMAIVLSHELHQHIGIYTILGAKMGVHAREALRVPRRSVLATLYTGGNQAMSCAADGLQMALGSTFGQNMIRIAPPEDGGAPRLRAQFDHGERRLRLTLKDEYAARIDAIIADASAEHGFLTPDYFDAIEAASYQIWAEFDRSEIFIEERLQIGAPQDTAPENGALEE